MTPAQKHKLRIAAEQAAMQGQNEATGNAYELLLAQLAQQKRELKNIKSMQARQEAKRQLLPEWSGYLEGAFNRTEGAVQDEIIGQLLIWSIDAGEYDQAIKIGAHMLKHGLTLPAHFERDTDEALTEEIAEAWLKNDTPTITLEQLREVERLTADYDMHDEIRAKLYRAIGEAEAQTGNTTEAIAALRQAITLNDRIGCKQLLTKLEKDNPDLAKE